MNTKLIVNIINLIKVCNLNMRLQRNTQRIRQISRYLTIKRTDPSFNLDLLLFKKSLRHVYHCAQIGSYYSILKYKSILLYQKLSFSLITLISQAHSRDVQLFRIYISVVCGRFCHQEFDQEAISDVCRSENSDY